jgi:Spermine/spermidine synthase domain
VLEFIFLSRRFVSLDGTSIDRNFSSTCPQNSSGSLKSRVQWAHKERGKKEVQSAESEGDIAQFLLGWMEFDMKHLVASVSTDYQNIEIYDVINPRFRSLKQFRSSMIPDGSYESMHPELYRPDRIVYLDGIMQSRYFGDAAYHEALVHPAMFTHKSPKRVAIVGGGEGATLREVLKHKTVETATMIEIDELMVNVSKEHLPEWSDCSRIDGSAQSCFDDPRAETFYTDAVEWFIKQFGDPSKLETNQRYDVVIMDAL